MYEDLKRFIEDHDRFVVTSHVNPDCDAIGSACAMSRLIEGLGKPARVINTDPTPPRFFFVDPEKRVQTYSAEVHPEPDEAVVVVDVGDLKRLGKLGLFLRDNPRAFACVDHHKSNTGFAEVNVLESDACATGLILYKIAKEWGVPITPELASELYIAIYTDTGGFRFSNTDAETLEVAADLVRCGANPSYLASEFNDREPLGRVRLFGRTLERIESDLEGKIVWVKITLEDLDSNGCDRSDVEGFVEYLRGIETAELAVLFRESEPGKTKLSFRSRDYVDCSVLAGNFNGGGHFHAAGGHLDIPVDEAVSLVIPKGKQEVLNGSA